MPIQLFKKTRQLDFDRTYAAPLTRVWQAWTDPELLRRWWGPDKTEVTECAIDLQVGGTIRVVMEAGAEMGRYAGTRWPMEGTFTAVEPETEVCYDARSWTAGKKAESTIEHTNTVTLTDLGDTTQVQLTIQIAKVGPKAKMAAYGMKWGYKAQLDNLATLLSSA